MHYNSKEKPNQKRQQSKTFYVQSTKSKTTNYSEYDQSKKYYLPSLFKGRYKQEYLSTDLPEQKKKLAQGFYSGIYSSIAQWDKYEKMYHQKNHQLKNKLNQLQISNQKINKLEKQTEQLKKFIAKQNQQKKNLNQAINKYEKTVYQIDHQLKNKLILLQVSDQKVNKLEKQIEQFKKLIAKQDQQKKKLNSTISLQRASLVKLTSQVDQNKKIIQKNQKKYQQLLLEKQNKCKEQIYLLQKKIKQNQKILIQQIKLYETNYEKIQKELNNAQINLKTKIEQKKRLNDLIKKLDKDLSLINQDKLNVKFNLSQLEQFIQKIQENMKMKNQLLDNNLASALSKLKINQNKNVITNVLTLLSNLIKQKNEESKKLEESKNEIIYLYAKRKADSQRELDNYLNKQYGNDQQKISQMKSSTLINFSKCSQIKIEQTKEEKSLINSKSKSLALLEEKSANEVQQIQSKKQEKQIKIKQKANILIQPKVEQKKLGQSVERSVGSSQHKSEQERQIQ